VHDPVADRADLVQRAYHAVRGAGEGGHGLADGDAVVGHLHVGLVHRAIVALVPDF